MNRKKRGAVFKKRNTRKGGICLNIKQVTSKPLLNECQICNLYDSIYECNICKKLICHKHSFNCKSTNYCIECYIHPNTNGIIMSIYLHEKRQTILNSILQKILYFISFEWSRKKVEPYSY
jgi:hypothetical protein